MHVLPFFIRVIPQLPAQTQTKDCW